MTPGTLRTRDGKTATVDADGWRSEDAAFAADLESRYPPPSTTAGTPWIQAFWTAVDGLGAEVLTEPEPEDLPPGAIG